MGEHGRRDYEQDPEGEFGRRDYDGVTHELLTASIAAAVEPLAREVGWLKWGVLALFGAIILPRLGGPGLNAVPTAGVFDPSALKLSLMVLFSR